MNIFEGHIELLESINYLMSKLIEDKYDQLKHGLKSKLPIINFIIKNYKFHLEVYENLKIKPNGYFEFQNIEDGTYYTTNSMIELFKYLKEKDMMNDFEEKISTYVEEIKLREL